ncbi:indolepyruvate ferredoxin oxidoreductase subunit alpha [Sedimentibacter sp. zth1]|uniref:indolepyruvate ferredoxin oxidoreductase subunit alpha n=1 Tax=Sedimentibacter sp. zth1 TaxID=2816908 RepID=UPI001A929D28|nr:indolepyruvate ferredoxin oxidoreductase subunit alpha [Sedimentibacter sp. zth1]QSX06368.1 indolepyruvate ferredoxin oxidoreductase subunit alpha [Sedimentibacter sp. zth1]
MKTLMTGNEAIARGAYEAGVTVASAYPGTPSTEIMENFSKYKGAHSEWAVNEKVACEVAAGASIRGARAFCAMKHVGLNVAADGFMSYSYHVTNGGFVLVTADEPNMFSSQNEQDNRYYALFGKTALIEPSDSQECIDFMKEAFNISEKFETPVVFRITTRICHSKSRVNLEERVVPPIKEYVKDPSKNLMLPAISRLRHPKIENIRLAGLKEYSNNCSLNRIEMNKTKIGIITSGVSYQYCKEVMGDNASYLKIGFLNPLPDTMIKDFASKVEKLYIIEESDPFIEEQVRAMGISCIGKDLFPICGEFSPALIRELLLGKKQVSTYQTQMQAPSRPPVLCAGCPHRGLFFELGKYKDKAFFSGDIGCYTLGAASPLNALDTTICMGASITGAHGFTKANEIANDTSKKAFAIIGDSTFFHSGITGLINSVYNNSSITTIILDNSITAMTGHQENPGTGKNITGAPAPAVDLVQLCYACGIKKENLIVVDPYDLAATKEAIKKGYEATEPFVIITKRPCALLKPVIKQRAKVKAVVNADKCRSCKMCLKSGCPALILGEKISIDQNSCNGCGVCIQICPFDAIERIGE